MVTINTNTTDLIDIAIEQYGHPAGVFFLLADNPEISGITAAAPSSLSVRENTKVKVEEVRFVPLIVAKLPPYIIKNRQSFFDIIIENQGTIEGVFPLMLANGFDGMTEHIFVDDSLTVLSSQLAPQVVVSNRNYMPIATIDEADKADGIGYMFINRNLITR